MRSLLLDRSTWDLVVDANGNLALCDEPYATLQAVACAARCWLGDHFYDTSLGISYQQMSAPGGFPVATLKNQIEQAAASVDGVQSAQCLLVGPRADRSLGGTILVKLKTGETANVDF
ncbi:hypothetical protein [Swingsia samuiensis]|uniref:Uncharacterized protein n=1 Tax=Swingsia samuiensis TaxID=1293412 RepID=A0A4Y6ULX5_9PROT|nr:hypothetical protein [Swingsia samuiensis]QDH17396.1 hypothetical protein E3D00_07335 [Swingsia samuiensis]